MALIRATALLLLAAGCASARQPLPPPTDGGALSLSVEGLEPGSSVGVAGSFNGWDPTGFSLREARPGVFEIRLELEPGLHRLQLVVAAPDGAERWIAPPGLERYEADGYGGSNGLVEIRRNLRADGSSIETK